MKSLTSFNAANPFFTFAGPLRSMWILLWMRLLTSAFHNCCHWWRPQVNTCMRLLNFMKNFSPQGLFHIWMYSALNRIQEFFFHLWLNLTHSPVDACARVIQMLRKEVCISVYNMLFMVLKNNQMISSLHKTSALFAGTRTRATSKCMLMKPTVTFILMPPWAFLSK